MYFARFILALLLATNIANAAPPQVVTDIPAVHSLVSLVMGELGEPALLTQSTSDPHNMQLRPSQARLLARADVLFWVGPGLTPWLERAIPKLNPDMISVPLIEAPGTHRIEIDPHAWLDPDNGAIWLDAIAIHLSQLDPQNATAYRRNAEVAQQNIAAQTANIQANLGSLGPIRVLLAHDSLAYFAQRFGITVAGSLSDSDDRPPGAARLRALRAMLQTDPVDCALVEPQQDRRILQSLLKGGDTPVLTFDPFANTLSLGQRLYGEMLNSIELALADCK